MKNKGTLIAGILAIIAGIAVFIYGVTFAGRFTPEKITCSPDTKATLAEIQKACADEIIENKNIYNQAHKRNEEIRKFLGKSDKDLVALWLMQTTATKENKQ